MKKSMKKKLQNVAIFTYRKLGTNVDFYIFMKVTWTQNQKKKMALSVHIIK